MSRGQQPLSDRRASRCELSTGNQKRSICFQSLQGLCQGLRLLERFPVFPFGVRVGNDPRSYLDMGGALFYDKGPDDDVQIHVSRVGDVADGAGIRASSNRLKLVDDLHASHLGHSGDRAPGKDLPDKVETVPPLRKLSADIRNNM